jgi:hypothetical protein
MFELLVCTMDLSASAERPLITSGPRSLSRDNKIQTRKWNGIKMVSSTTTKELKSPKQSQPRDIVRDANPPLSPRLLSVFPPFGAVTAWPSVAPKARCSCCSEPLRRYSSHGGFPPGQWMATGDVCEYPAVFLGARAFSLLSVFLPVIGPGAKGLYPHRQFIGSFYIFALFGDHFRSCLDAWKDIVGLFESICATRLIYSHEVMISLFVTTFSHHHERSDMDGYGYPQCENTQSVW